MIPRLIGCPQCRTSLIGEEFFNTTEFVGCPTCGTPLRVEVFPALFRNPEERRSQAEALVEGESSCFYHPQKKAVISCQACGRFLCALCDLELHDQHLCPVCLERGQQKRTLKNLENRRIRYDYLALILALVPLLLWPFTLIGAPAAVYVAIRYWKAPRSLVRQSRLRMGIALLIGLLEIGVWAFVIAMVFIENL